MPSPFPGIDPYLEGREWTSLHHSLAEEFLRQLAPGLRPRYRALCEKRFVAETPGSVSVTTSDLYPDGAITPSEIAEVSAAPASIQMRTLIPAPIPHVTVEIRTVDGHRLVTAIEILSPSNKRGHGREEYLAKRQKILLSEAHLVEIDLLRRGARVPMAEPLPDTPYFVIISRGDNRPLSDVWPIVLEEPLPTVPIPLLPGDDAPLDLQAAFGSVYDLLGFDLVIDYAQPPKVPLEREEREWARRILVKAVI